MLYLFHGTDTERVRDKAHALVASLVAKKPDVSVTTVAAEEFDERSLSDLARGQGLFERKRIIVLDTVLTRADAREAVLESAPDIASSENIFVFLEGVLPAATLRALEKHASKTQVFGKDKKASGTAFNIFSLGDALGRRDRKGLWVLYRKAKLAGFSDEEILGTLFWQMKVVVSAAHAGSPEEAGQKPFVFQKARRFGERWGKQAESCLADLLALYHDARRGKHDLGTALERFLLRT